MKKFFSVLIAVTMILSSFVSFAAETTNTTTDAAINLQFSDVEKGSVVEEAVENLVANNIINGYPDGTFKPNGDITRAEFAAVIARFKGIATNLSEDAVTGFSDLDSDDSYKWARPYVKAAVDSGIINGFEDGTFRASEYVTYEQAVKMIVCAIDYHAMANSELTRLKMLDSSVRWSAGYISAASKIGVSKNALMSDVTQPANRGLVAILTNNAFSAPKVDVTTDKQGNVSYSPSTGGGSSGGDRSDTQEMIKGIVTATKYTSLDGQDSGLKNREIKIGDKVYEVERELNDKLNYLDLIGNRVTAYYSKSDGEISSIKVTTNEKYIVRIEEEDLVRPFVAEEIKHLDSELKNKSEEMNGYKFIYNGKYIPDATFDMFDLDGEYPFKNGSLEIIKDSSSKVVKITSFDVFVVRRFDSSNKKVTFRYKKKYNGQDYYEFPSRPSERPVIYKNGKQTDLDELTLKDYDVINLMESPKETVGEHAKLMYVTSGGKTGEVEEELIDSREIQIGGRIYYLTNDYANYEPQSTGDEEKPSFRIEDKYNFFVDYTGQIAAIKYSAATTVTNYKYGYLIIADNSEETCRIRYIDENGNAQNRNLKSKIELDGKEVNASAAVNSLIRSAKEANRAYNARVEADEKWNASPLSGDYYAQPIRISLTGAMVDGIDTVLKGEGGPEDLLNCVTSLESGKVSVNTTTAGSSSVNSSTKILYVPDDRTDSAAYRSLSNSEAFSINKKRYVEVFTTTGTAAYILVYQTNPLHEFKGTSPYMMVSFIDKNGDFINGYGSSTGETAEKLIIADSDNFKTDIDPACVAVSDLNKGDVIQYVLDTKRSPHEVVAIRRIYNAANPSQAVPVEEVDLAKANRYCDYSVGNTYLRASYGSLLYDYALNESGKVRFTWFIKEDSNELPKESVEGTIAFNVSGKNLIEFNGSEVKKLNSLGSIATMDESNPSEVLIMSSSIANNSAAGCVFVFNTKPVVDNDDDEPTDEDSTEGKTE
ncbi:MAG: S-layer homology domain-containing protein [Clostridia bacterium]|nr:S-layer homology domain-containing protein [Clostridia bacterium]